MKNPFKKRLEKQSKNQNLISKVRRLNPFLRKNDEALAQAFGRGDVLAFNQVTERYQKPIFKYVLQKVGNEEVSEELAQEIFLKVFRFRENYDPQYALSTWIWTVARNSILDWKRKEGIQVPIASSQNEGEEERNLIEEVACSDLNAEAVLFRKLRKRKLVQLLKALTRIQRRVVWLRAFHHLSYPEIARKLGVSLDAVKSAAYRARYALLSSLEDLTSPYAMT